MRLKKLIVNNFASYKDEIIDFESYGNGPFLLCGENGAGKSTIIEMITVAIFNRCNITDSKGAGLDELINSDAESFKIDLTFEQNGNNYEIIRERNKKSQKLKLFINGEQAKGKLTETQAMINSIVKLSYETFVDSVIIGQNKSSSFMEKSPTERKNVLVEILGLDIYTTLETYTKDLRKELKNKISFKEDKLESLSTLVSNKSNYENELNSISGSIFSLEADIKTYEELLEKELSEKAVYEQMKKQNDMMKNRKNQLANKITSIENNIKKGQEILVSLKVPDIDLEGFDLKVKTLKDKIVELRDTSRQFSDEKMKLQTENNINEKEINKIKEKGLRLKKYGEATCEFCGQNITSEYKEKHLAEMMKEMKNLRAINDNNNIAIKEYLEKVSNINFEIKDTELKIRKLQDDKNEVEKIEIKRKNVEEKINDLNNQLIEANKEKEELDLIQEVNLDFKTFKDYVYRDKLNFLRNEFNRNNARISVLNSELERIKENTDEYNKLKEEIKEDKVLLKRYELLQKAYSKDGIPALIIDSVMPQLEQETNKYLSILSDGKISIMFKTQDTNKSGNTKETLDIIVSDQSGNKRSYNLFSGGQKMRISLSMRIALSKMLANRNNTSIDFFFIDEAMSPLDEAGKSAFLDTINIISTMFPQIFVISHIDDIKEAFAKKLLVTNNPTDGSKVSLIK